jgi:hypothetical protein
VAEEIAQGLKKLRKKSAVDREAVKDIPQRLKLAHILLHLRHD